MKEFLRKQQLRRDYLPSGFYFLKNFERPQWHFLFLSMSYVPAVQMDYQFEIKCDLS